MPTKRREPAGGRAALEILVGYDGETDAYTMHYFDARGVVRIYRMDFRDGVWTPAVPRTKAKPGPLAQASLG